MTMDATMESVHEDISHEHSALACDHIVSRHTPIYIVKRVVLTKIKFTLLGTN